MTTTQQNIQNTTAEMITAAAKRFGADDVRFAPVTGLDAFPTLSLPENAQSIIVLFTRYAPSAPAPSGQMSLSAYYIASHRAYHAAKKLSAFLCEHGISAVHTKTLDCKTAALQTGGLIGDNGFYYHPEYGSFVNIQTIVTDMPPEKNKCAQHSECLHCGACAAACPSGAVGDITLCLRRYFDGEVPPSLRGDVYQLLGCEKCQAACPLNVRASSLPYAYPVADLLEGKYVAQMQALAGTNMVRKQRVRSQAALFAANSSLIFVQKQLAHLSETAPEPVKTHAMWAAAKLSKNEEIPND